MASRPRPPRILFVMQTALGWSSSAAHMQRILAERTDITAKWITVPQLGWRRHFIKRTVRSGWRDIFRRVSPLQAYRGAVGEDLRAEAEAFQPDLIHCAGHWPAAAFPAGIPLSLVFDSTMRGINTSLRPDYWTPAEIEEEDALLRRAHLLWPMSHWADSFIPQDAIAARHVLPPSVRIPENHTGLRNANPVPQILFVGNDFERKGGARLLQLIDGPLTGRAHLHIVSANAPAVDHPDVTVHGAVDNAALVNDLMPRQDILCLPTYSDMSPLVLAEAAAAGLAMIASDFAGLSELIADGKTGYLVPRDSDHGFLATIERLVGDPDHLATLQSSARQDAEGRFCAYNNFSALLDELVHVARQSRKSFQ